MRETHSRVSGLDPRRIALPHDLTATGAYRVLPFQKTDATMNSAGGHLATVADLARWITVQMDSGRIEGRQVFPPSAVALGHRMLAAHTREGSRRFAQFTRDGWGAGWDLGRYEGEPMVSRFGGYSATRSHISFLPRRRIGFVGETTAEVAGPIIHLLAALVFDLEAGRPEGMGRARARLEALVDSLPAARAQVAASDSVRSARQKAPSRPIGSFAGVFEAPGYGRIGFEARGGGLWFRWGVLSGPVELLDGARDQLRIEIAGQGTAARFGFDDRGRATSVTVNDVVFRRSTP
jgi:hypothetical protein